MCGRFVAATDPDGLVRFFTIDERKDDDLPPSYNVAPTDPVRAVAAHAGRRYLVTFRWGLVPHWAESPKLAATMINARAETVATKPAFRDALRRRRCLIPADGFYEWKAGDDGVKVPHFIRSADGAPLAFAGLWETWRDADGRPLKSCTIVTRAAQGPVTDLHDRMPLALPSAAWSPWLDAATGAEEVTALLHSEPPRLRFHAVTTRVNAVRNNDPTLIEAA
ncbi:MAG TPA: SOS response-associated peptidase [Egibacteraceae bacterium]|nr:SOS response-associated peptidase [Egibacteraceae bacterium]